MSTQTKLYYTPSADSGENLRYYYYLGYPMYSNSEKRGAIQYNCAINSGQSIEEIYRRHNRLARAVQDDILVLDSCIESSSNILIFFSSAGTLVPKTTGKDEGIKIDMSEFFQTQGCSGTEANIPKHMFELTVYFKFGQGATTYYQVSASHMIHRGYGDYEGNPRVTGCFKSTSIQDMSSSSPLYQQLMDVNIIFEIDFVEPSLYLYCPFSDAADLYFDVYVTAVTMRNLIERLI